MHIPFVLISPPENNSRKVEKSSPFVLSGENFAALLERDLQREGDPAQETLFSNISWEGEELTTAQSLECGIPGNGLNNLSSGVGNCPIPRRETRLTPCGNTMGNGSGALSSRAGNCPIQPSCHQSETAVGSALVNNSLGQLENLERWKQGIAAFLDEVESIHFTLDLGEKGNVEFTGGKLENGEFRFTFQGNQEAIIGFLGNLAGLLTGLGIPGMGNAAGCVSGLGMPGLRQDPEFVACILAEQDEDGSVDNQAASDVDGANSGEPSFELGIDQIFTEGEVPENGKTIQLEKHTNKPDNPVLSGVNTQPDNLPNVQPASWFPEPGPGQAGTPIVATFVGERAAETLIPFQERSNSSGEKQPVGELFRNLSSEVSGSVKSNDGIVKDLAFQVSAGSGSEETAEFFNRIFDALSRERGTKEVVIKMEPETLGSITVRLTEDGNRVSCLWQISDPRTRELIERQLPILEARLNEQGMTFANFLGEDRSGRFSRQWTSPAFIVDQRVNDTGFPEDSRFGFLGEPGNVNLVV